MTFIDWGMWLHLKDKDMEDQYKRGAHDESKSYRESFPLYIHIWTPSQLLRDNPVSYLHYTNQ